MPPGGLALGVIPTGVRLFFFYFLNFGGGGVGPRGVFSFLSVFFYKDLGKKEAVCIVLQNLCFRFFWQTRNTKKIIHCAQYCVRHARARREAGDCRGVRAASPVRALRRCAACTTNMYMCMHLGLHVCVLCAVCRQTGQQTERMAERARSVPRARLVQCRICVVQARGGRGAAEHAG